jgi:hypothetical protein
VEELILLVVVVGLFAVAALGIQQLGRAGRLRRELGMTPPGALPPTGDDSDIYVRQARESFRYAQRAVRLLERVLAQDETIPILTAETRAEIRTLIDQFYES